MHKSITYQIQKFDFDRDKWKLFCIPVSEDHAYRLIRGYDLSLYRIVKVTTEVVTKLKENVNNEQIR